MIEVTCSSCSLKIRVPASVAGRSGVCFGCGAKIQVPDQALSESTLNVDFSPGQVIDDRYVIDACIGEGGMGVVYRAHDKLVGEELALKFMNPRALKTQRGQSLFIKEAQLARRLRHENIVAVHDVSTTAEGVLYLSMELLKGTSLRDFLRKHRNRKKHLDVRFAIRIILQILSGLIYAHKLVVHRDLKPENVMLLPGDRAKVLDFGLALAIEEEHEVAAPTGKKKRIIGTAVYASPEQRRHHSVDSRSDLFTVGLLLKEVLTLRTPADEQVDIMDARDDVAPSIVAVYNRAVLPEKERRYQSAREFRDELSAAYKESYVHKEVAEVVTKSGRTVDTQNMVFMEGGSFMMGSNDSPAESPEHEAVAAPFYIDRYPVTFEEYANFVEETEYRTPKFWDDAELNGPRQPVTGIALSDAQAYAQWAGKTLPSECQWEFAAGGRDKGKYPWGSFEVDTTRCNYGDYLGMPSIVTMHDTGQTPTGIFDMAGNVYEWTVDHYLPYRQGGHSDEAIAKEPRRVVRGGSWHSTPDELTCTSRKGLFPESQLATVGFRCVVDAEDVGN
ncbi:MAG: bifunctional serine/threonine-protein kinase/formylglycine-generating enzyme family protein [Candidatus Hydrogenedentota bacterium]